MIENITTSVGFYNSTSLIVTGAGPALGVPLRTRWHSTVVSVLTQDPAGLGSISGFHNLSSEKILIKKIIQDKAILL